MAATCSPTLKPHTPPNTTPQPQAHTHRSQLKDGQIVGWNESALSVSRGAKERKRCDSVLLDAPQLPDVTLFNDIIMTVL